MNMYLTLLILTFLKSLANSAPLPFDASVTKAGQQHQGSVEFREDGALMQSGVEAVGSFERTSELPTNLLRLPDWQERIPYASPYDIKADLEAEVDLPVESPGWKRTPTARQVAPQDGGSPVKPLVAAVDEPIGSLSEGYEDVWKRQSPDDSLNQRGIKALTRGLGTRVKRSVLAAQKRGNAGSAVCKAPQQGQAAVPANSETEASQGSQSVNATVLGDGSVSNKGVADTDGSNNLIEFAQSAKYPHR